MCFAASLSADGVQLWRKEVRPGDAPAVRRVVAEQLGHCLMIAEVDGGPFLNCATCGAWCTSKSWAWTTEIDH